MHITKDLFFCKRSSSLCTDEGGGVTSLFVCHRLAEQSVQGGAGGRLLMSRVDVGMRDDQRQPRGFMKGKIPLGEERVVLAVQCTARRNKWAPVETTSLEEGLISYLSLQSVLLWLSPGYECRLSLSPLDHHPLLHATLQQHKPRGRVKGGSVSREGKRASSLSFITQVSSKRAIFNLTRQT